MAEPSTPPARLLVVRHRQSTYNIDRRFTGRADPPLSEEGTVTAGRMASVLAALGLDAIVSSPLRRAAQTADAVAAVCGLAVQLDGRLVEHDIPAWEGLTRDEIEAGWPGAWARWKDERVLDVPGAEPWSSVEARVAASLLDHASPARRTLVVAHAGVLRALGTGPLASPLKVTRSKGRWVEVVDGRLLDGGLERVMPRAEA